MSWCTKTSWALYRRKCSFKDFSYVKLRRGKDEGGQGYLIVVFAFGPRALTLLRMRLLVEL